MGGSSGGQEAVISGPSVNASQAAAQAQITAAQIAAQAATQNTQSAIQSLMGEYTTSLGITEPIREYGNSAAGQLNYILGLAPAPLPTAPTAPTAPTLEQALSYVTPSDIRQYVIENSQQVANTHGQYFGNARYTGAGANSAAAGAPIANNSGTNSGWMGTPSGDVILGGAFNNIVNNPGLNSAIKNELAQELIQNPNSILNTNYANQQQLYNQQKQVYNEELPIAQHYQDLGTASSKDIANIVTNLPGFQFQQQQGLSQIQNAASAKGLLNSGVLLQDLDQFGQGLAQTFYNNYASQLQGLAGLGTGASQQQAQGANQLGGLLAGAQTDLGNTLANAALAAGQATASSYLNPVQNQQFKTQSIGGGGGGSGIGGILSGGASLIGALGGFF